ncbi:trypsin-like peptidase domain-containing protein [Maribacter polysiphoniae]|uniref:trypsin-like peptidase domain-containing protein n=1 Tax=Maribacter polysiphoniae TaxID=429344 RepID=UPI002358026C|nr:trypsin-like peptidase domain-containing protein [Maribacter polysiphoniae]
MKNILLFYLLFGLSNHLYTQENSLIFFSKSKATEEQNQVGKSLGLIRIHSEGGRCNGFLVTDEIIMTNAHCLANSNYSLTDISITFNYGEKTQETFNCGNVLYKNEDLDLALLKLEKAIPKNQYRKPKYPNVIFANKRLKKNDSILLINYNHDNPDYKGDLYKIFTKGQVLFDEKTTDAKLYYKALAHGGSSGSAVFSKNSNNGEYYFVGLHNVGYGDIFNDGYKGGVSADLIYDKIMSLDEIEIDDVAFEKAYSAQKKFTFYENGNIKSVGYYLPERYKVYVDSDLGRKRGKWNTYYENGELKYKQIYNIINGYKSGEWVTYFPEGKIHSIVNYKNGFLRTFDFETIRKEFGIRHGKSVDFYKNGNIRYEKYYKSGIKSGVWTNYRPDGKVNFILDFDKPETLNQTVQFYDQFKGELYFKGNLKNGNYDGIWELFNPSGPVWKGNIKPKFRVFNHKNENVGLKLLYRNGKEIGKGESMSFNYYAFHKRDKTKIDFICNFFDKKCTAYYQNGDVRYERTYSEKGIVGNFIKSFDKAGNSAIINGNGYVYDYYENGKIRYKAEVKNGCLNGKIKLFNDDGVVESVKSISNCEIQVSFATIITNISPYIEK